MDKLSREELERMKKRAENVYAIMGDQNTKKHILIIDTALSLYAENSKLKEGIERVREKWLKGLNGAIITEQFIMNMFLQDLTALLNDKPAEGEGENDNG